MKRGDLVRVDFPAHMCGRIGVILERFHYPSEGMPYFRILLDSSVHLFPDYWLKVVEE